MTKKIPATHSLLANDTTASPQVIMAPDVSHSHVADPYESDEFRLEWDNQVKFHVSRHLQHLRRYRGESQKSVAKAIGSSQPAIARIEGGDENITLDTAERITRHLKGRFRVSIAPAELPSPPHSLWWEDIEGQLAPGKRVEPEWYTLTLGLKVQQTPHAFVIGVTSPSAAQAFYSGITGDPESKDQ